MQPAHTHKQRKGPNQTELNSITFPSLNRDSSLCASATTDSHPSSPLSKSQPSAENQKVWSFSSGSVFANYERNEQKVKMNN